jgi:hypothetical protein
MPKEKETQETRPVETWAEAKNTPAWLFAAARALAHWAAGQEVAEAEYDRAIAQAQREVIRNA